MKNAIAAAVLFGIALCLDVSAFDASSQEDGVRHMNLPGRGDDLPFSHAVLAGETLYVAGTLGIDPETGQPPEDVEAEARLVLDGIKAKLALADMTMDDLVSIQVFCPDLTLYEQFNAVYGTYFEKNFPARAFIGSGPLLRNARFEVNGIAVRH